MNTSKRFASPDSSRPDKRLRRRRYSFSGYRLFCSGGPGLRRRQIGPVKNSLIFYKPTGPLSGVTTAAILIWLVTWGFLNGVGGKGRSPSGASLVRSRCCSVLSLLLTFPPIVDLF